MKRKVYVESFLGQKRLAVVEDGVLQECAVERPGCEKLSGNLYKGVVRDILPGMQAAFVDIGLEKNGYLYMDDIAIDRREMTDNLKAQIRGKGAGLKRGKEMLVQIVKETSGGKGPRITGNVTLPGMLCVFLPTLDYVGVSRKITDTAERERLGAIAERVRPEGAGLIVRTAAEGVCEEEFRREVALLSAVWRSIEQSAAYSKAPVLLHSDAALEFRAVRDLLTADTEEIVFDDAETYESAKRLALLLSPDSADRLKLYTGEIPLFEEMKLDAQAKKAFDRQVALPSGGYIVIDYTEALTVVDVNTGSYVGKIDLEDTVYTTNLEAARETARQLRLRDIGGIIVVDFIDMNVPEHEQGVLEAFREALGADRARTNLVGFTGLGLVELTRRKFQQPVYRVLNEPCPRCSGSGWSPSPESGAREALWKLHVRMIKKESGLFMISAAPKTAELILKLGISIKQTVFVYVDNKRPEGDYDLSPASETDIPKNAVRLGHGARDR